MGFFWCKKRKNNKVANDLGQESEDKKEKTKKKRWWQRLLLAFRWNLFSCCISKDVCTSTSPSPSSSRTVVYLSRGRVALPRISSEISFPPFLPLSSSTPPMTVDLSSICHSKGPSSSTLSDSEACLSSSYDYDTDEDLDSSSSSETKYALEPSQHKTTRITPVSILFDSQAEDLQHPEKGQGEEDASLPDIKNLGFPNLGYTCYLNATLQCMLSLSCFWTFLRGLPDNWKHTSNFPTIRCFAELQKARYSNNKQKRKILRALISCLSARLPIFSNYEQQDAHEFLTICLMVLKEEGESLRESIKSYICPVSHFEFKIRTVRTCPSCGLQRFSVEDYNHLSINQSSTLTHSLHTYFQKSNTELVCECREGTCMTEVQEFYTLPRVLILQVKRFNMFGEKLRDVMNIPPELDLSGFPGVASLGNQPSGSGCPQASPDLVYFPTESGEGHVKREQCTVECPPTSVYRLHGIVSHTGRSLDCGHYISDVAEGQGNSWLTLDDSEVSCTKESVVLKRRERGAYLLFYVHSGAEENNVAFGKREQKRATGRVALPQRCISLSSFSTPSFPSLRPRSNSAPPMIVDLSSICHSKGPSSSTLSDSG
ncbi:ubiquitin carboxyl-terminal hydrolase 29-like [Hoplias malabaricus]|uniref:ubiquitin carboxyl-terminal hydrolase 29-like n=1 Tax=Hoplias malabaricus TaxID=27720 RepID=UPI0034630C49